MKTVEMENWNYISKSRWAGKCTNGKYGTWQNCMAGKCETEKM